MSLFIDLEKAQRKVDKSKLVLRQIQVTLPNGTTYMRQQWVDPSDDVPQMKTKKPEEVAFEYNTFLEFSKSKQRKEGIEYLKKNGVQWNESPEEGINWMRASMAAKKHSQNKQEQPKKQDTVVKEPIKEKKVVDKPTRSPKEMVTHIRDKHGKDAVMEMARKNGVNWKENANKDLNWMRCAMALKKFYEGGGKLSSSGVSKPVKEEPKVEPKIVETPVLKESKPKPKTERGEGGLTKLEQTMMENIINDTFYENGSESTLWVDVMLDDLKMPTSQSRAILTTLKTKGLISIDGSGKDKVLTLTDSGVNWLIDRGLVDEDGYALSEPESTPSPKKTVIEYEPDEPKEPVAKEPEPEEVKEDSREPEPEFLDMETLMKLHQDMLERGAPDSVDRQGYNKFDYDFASGVHEIHTAKQALTMAKILKKYAGTQLGMSKELFDRSIEMYNQGVNGGSKPADEAEKPEKPKVVHDIGYKEREFAYYITGNTFPAKDLIKKAGAKWDGYSKTWEFSKKKFDEETIKHIVEVIRRGEEYGADQGNQTDSRAIKGGVQGVYTRLNQRIPLRDAKQGEYGRILATRGKVSEKEQRVSKEIGKVLRPHQLDGANLAIDSIEAYGGFLLSDGTGAGKTIQELAVAHHYMSQDEKVLIVVPNDGVYNQAFKGDANILGISKHLKMVKNTEGTLEKGKINFITYSSLSKLKDKPDYLIFDECHYLKNVHESARSKRGIALSKSSKGTMFCSATPIDKAKHIQYLEKLGIFSGTSFSNVMSKLGYRYEEKSIGRGQTVGEWVRAVSIDQAMTSLEEFFDELSDLGIMTKREVSMDKVSVSFNTITMPQEVHKELAAIQNYYGDTPNNRALILMAQRRVQEPYKIPEVVKTAKSRIAEGHKIVIFANRVNDSEIEDKSGYVDSIESEGTIKKLLAQLEGEGYEVAKIFGNKTVAKEIDKFQNGSAQIAIVTPEKGGAGLSLDDVSGSSPRTMIVMTPPFSAVDNVQMAGRVNRLNTKSNSDIIFMLGNTEVDEWNQNIIAEKMKTLKAAVKGDISKLAKSTLCVISKEDTMSFKEDMKKALLDGDSEKVRSLIKSDLVETTISVYRNGRTYHRRQLVKKDKVEGAKKVENIQDKPDTYKRPSKKPKFGSSEKDSKSKSKGKFVSSSKLKGKHLNLGESDGFSYVKFLSLSKNKDKALSYLEKFNIEWKKSDDADTNWTRACKAAKKYAIEHEED